MNNNQLELVEKIGMLLEKYEMTPEEVKTVFDYIVSTYKLYYMLDEAGLLDSFLEMLEDL